MHVTCSNNFHRLPNYIFFSNKCITQPTKFRKYILYTNEDNNVSSVIIVVYFDI